MHGNLTFKTQQQPKNQFRSETTKPDLTQPNMQTKNSQTMGKQLSINHCDGRVYHILDILRAGMEKSEGIQKQQNQAEMVQFNSPCLCRLFTIIFVDIYLN